MVFMQFNGRNINKYIECLKLINDNIKPMVLTDLPVVDGEWEKIMINVIKVYN